LTFLAIVDAVDRKPVMLGRDVESILTRLAADYDVAKAERESFLLMK
jgi:ATP-dependent protease Clp ATPase subunit